MRGTTERRRRPAGALLAVTVATLAAVLSCGAGASVRVGAQDDGPPSVFRVAGIVDAELFGGAELGARARLQAANAEGGVDGVPIELVGVHDDRRDASVASAEARRLVEDEEVDALVPVVTSRFTDDETLADARRPAFGWGISSGFCGSRWAFGITGCLAPLLPRQVPTIWGELVADVLAARGVEAPTVALVVEAAAVPRTLDELRAIARAAGLRVVDARAELGSGADAAAGADAVAAAVLAREQPPDAVFTVASFAVVGAFQDALRARGYGGVMTNLVQYGPALAPAATGAYVLTQFATPEAVATDPAMQQILAEIAAVTPDTPSPAMLAGWFAADLYVEARRAAGADAPPARVAREAAKLRYEVPATIGPTDFPNALVRPASCGQLVKSDGSAFSVAAPFRCAGYARVRDRRR